MIINSDLNNKRLVLKLDCELLGDSVVEQILNQSDKYPQCDEIMLDMKLVKTINSNLFID